MKERSVHLPPGYLVTTARTRTKQEKLVQISKKMYDLITNLYRAKENNYRFLQVRKRVQSFLLMMRPDATLALSKKCSFLSGLQAELSSQYLAMFKNIFVETIYFLNIFILSVLLKRKNELLHSVLLFMAALNFSAAMIALLFSKSKVL